MCRWAAYIGSPVYLDEVVSKPEHSLIERPMQTGLGLLGTEAEKNLAYTEIHIQRGLTPIYGRSHTRLSRLYFLRMSERLREPQRATTIVIHFHMSVGLSCTTVRLVDLKVFADVQI